MTISVEVLQASGEAEYEEFIARFPSTLAYASLRFRSFLTDLLGCEARYLIARDGGVVGVLPVMVKSGAFGDVVNSLPYYGSNGGIIAASEDAADALAGEFAGLAGLASTAVTVSIDSPFETHGAPYDCTHHDERIGQITRLPGPGEALLDLIDSSARRNAAKAEREGVAVAVENDAWDFLRETHQENMRQIGGRAKDARFFDVFARHFRGDSDYRLWVARRDGERSAALLALYYGVCAEYYMPVTVEAEREYQPMARILVAAMTDAAGRGLRWWNWGGTWQTQEGVYRFKKKWGAEDHRYRYHIRLNNPEILERSPAELLAAYPGFYTVPFSALKASQ